MSIAVISDSLYYTELQRTETSKTKIYMGHYGLRIISSINHSEREEKK